MTEKIIYIIYYVNKMPIIFQKKQNGYRFNLYFIFIFNMAVSFQNKQNVWMNMFLYTHCFEHA